MFFLSVTGNFPGRGASVLSNQSKVSKKDKFRMYSANSDCNKDANCLMWKYFSLIPEFTF